jgi:hypothetical protein
MREITDTASITVKQYSGNEPHVIIAADGRVMKKQLKPDKTPKVMRCPAGCTILVGTEAEITAEAARLEAAYKASKE